MVYVTPNEAWRVFGTAFGDDTLAKRIRNGLGRAGYCSVDDVRRAHDLDLLSLRAFGRVMLERVRATVGYEEPRASLIEGVAPPAWTVIC